MKVYRITKNIECKPVETYRGFLICREVDRPYRPDTGEFYGHKSVFYTVNDDDCMIDSFKTINEARHFVDRLL